MGNSMIRDIPALKESLQQVKTLVILKRTLPIFAPILKLLSIDLDKISNALDQSEELAKQIEELSQLPDQFNDIFSERGWVIYEMLNLEVAKKAIEIAKTESVDQGEQILIDHYTPELVRSWLILMRAVQSFQPRMRLAELALKDYEEERYHACIPVVLALLDGLVNELNGGRGFFADDTELIAWNSISAHKKGLVTLGNIFRKGRNKTRAEQIAIPYRNGIMHGSDLGYDNRIVAAKVWAALFAVRDWAMKVERDLLTGSPQKVQTTIEEIVRKYTETQRDKEFLEQWQPRSITIGNEIPNSGTPDKYGEGTPERSLVEFLSFWKKKNYGYMAQHVVHFSDAPMNSMPKEIRDTLSDKELVDFVIEEVQDRAAALTEIRSKLTYLQDGKEVVKDHRYRLLYQDINGQGGIPVKNGYRWYIYNWGFL